jgi:arginine deiminase
MTTSMIIDRAHGGAGWQGSAERHEADLRSWRAFGCASESGRLERVVLSYPHPAAARVEHPEDADWTLCPDLGQLRVQIETLAEIYDKHGVEVHLVEPEGPAMTNNFFMRDLFAMTPAGAIVSRLASPVRWGEEAFGQAQLARLGVPVVASVIGEARFEGPDIVFLDSSTALVATSIRSNTQGAAQVTSFLMHQGIEAIPIQTTYGCGHLDGVLSIIGEKIAVAFPKRLSFTAYEHLSQRGFDVLALPDLEEAEVHMAINMVAIEPGLVLMPCHCPKTQAMLRDAGVHAVTANVSEAIKAGGAMHCMTGVIKRSM